MVDTAVIHFMREAFYVILVISAPILGVATVVGLVVSIIQTTTSIQEQTLTFVPKIISIFLALGFFMSWIIAFMKGYTKKLFIMIGQFY